MGVPAFFRWLCTRNPKCLVELLENSDDDTFTLNPDIDNLYLDMNGIIHPCSHPEGNGIPIPVTYHDMFTNVFHYIDRLMDLVRPKKLLYLAVDGVAPRAKLNQQRSRRFRAAQESQRVQNEKQRLRDYWAAQGLQNSLLDDYISNPFDSNQITPGTEFMHQLSYALQYYIYDRLNNNPLFQELIVVFSDASIPGEGEHKMLQFIRDQRKQEGYSPNMRHCLYGADADLIMLGLSTHEPWFYVIRETIMSNDDKFCVTCQQKGHFFTACPKKDVELNMEFINQMMSEAPPKPAKHKVIQVNFQMIQLSVVREFLKYEMRELPDIDLERLIDDFIFMCFLVGNDFLPHIPCLKITEGGIDCLLLIYKQIFTLMGDYITNCGSLNYGPLNQYLFHIGLVEEDLLRGQDRKKEINKSRRENNNHQQRQEPQVIQITLLDEKQDILEKFKQHLKEKLTEINQQEINNAQNQQITQVQKRWKFLSNKQRYYQEKFGVKATQFMEFISHIKLSYIEALTWTLKYYYSGCVDWGWFYPYHYAPFAQDLCNVDQIYCDFSLNAPFSPYQQLLAVLPPQSVQFLPKPYQSLVLDPQSPIADFYPSDFYVDLKGKKFAWLGEVVLPFVDAERLVHASKINVNTLSRYEQERDKFGQTLLYVHVKQRREQFDFSNSSIQAEIEWLQRFPVGYEIRSPIPTMPQIACNQVITASLIRQMVREEKGFIQNKVLPGCIEPLQALDDYYVGQCDNNRRSFGGEAVRRIVGSIIRVNRPVYRRPNALEESLQRKDKRVKV